MNFNWENLPRDLSEKSFSQYREVVEKVIAIEAPELNESHQEDNYPLQMFLDRIAKAKDIFTVSQISSIVFLLRTDCNIDLQDKVGNTALHCASNLFPIRTSEHCPETFTDLLKLVFSIRNCEVQNKKGCTALHILAKTFFLSQNYNSSDILSAFDLLSTKENVNIPDINFVTPYTWILRGKMVAENVAENNGIFTDIEKILIKKGACLEMAEKGLGATL